MEGDRPTSGTAQTQAELGGLLCFRKVPNLFGRPSTQPEAVGGFCQVLAGGGTPCIMEFSLRVIAQFCPPKKAQTFATFAFATVQSLHIRLDVITVDLPHKTEYSQRPPCIQLSVLCNVDKLWPLGKELPSKKFPTSSTLVAVEAPIRQCERHKPGLPIANDWSAEHGDFEGIYTLRWPA